MAEPTIHQETPLSIPRGRGHLQPGTPKRVATPTPILRVWLRALRRVPPCEVASAPGIAGWLGRCGRSCSRLRNADAKNMNNDQLPPAWKNQFGLSCRIAAVQAVAVAYRIWQAAHQVFGPNPVRNGARFGLYCLVSRSGDLGPVFRFPFFRRGGVDRPGQADQGKPPAPGAAVWPRPGDSRGGLCPLGPV